MCYNYTNNQSVDANIEIFTVHALDNMILIILCIGYNSGIHNHMTVKWVCPLKITHFLQVFISLHIKKLPYLTI